MRPRPASLPFFSDSGRMTCLTKESTPLSAMLPGSQKAFFNFFLTAPAESSRSIFESSSEELILPPVRPGTEGQNKVMRVSECWRFYALLTARVIFTAKTCFDIFSLSREQVWTFSVLGDRIYEMRCPFVAVGLNACFIVLPHWDKMS